MNKKVILIVAGVCVGGCCLLGTGLLALGALAADDGEAPQPPAAGSERATAELAPPSGGDDALGGYRLSGSATVLAEGFSGSLAGNWMLMDGATSIESIERLSEGVVKVRNNRSGELWHFTFDDGGHYTFRYVFTVNRMASLSAEEGDYTSDGATLTLTPSSCTTRFGGESSDCLEPAPRAYAMTTIQMEELVQDNQTPTHWQGLQLTGPHARFASGANNLANLKLQRVR